ncbi:hypothetical protein GCM10018789_25380 [Streptomyces werraensis]|nr:hypothetical protein GCM10018789_25380 [Streptomyces werraensis]
MHAASLTKGYGGNPPSGRSVSPPRTGPFFLPAVRHPSCPPSGTAPVAIRHSLAAPRGPPATDGPAPMPGPVRAAQTLILATFGTGVPLTVAAGAGAGATLPGVPAAVVPRRRANGVPPQHS